ncbi:MAG TPA: HAD family hydrolase, partial [Myxococcota bacterium]|nr:HAD family hydrolase [Myxococcota bacterium]
MIQSATGRLTARFSHNLVLDTAIVGLREGSVTGRPYRLPEPASAVPRTSRVTPVRGDSGEVVSLPGRAWIAASKFLARSQSATLNAIKDEIRLAAEVAKRTGTPPPVVIYDLDGTLFDNRFRTLKILQEWLADTSDLPANIREAFEGLRAPSIAYDLAGTFERLGLAADAAGVRDALASASRYWKERFFTNGYMQYDRPHLGALAYAKALHEAGAM